MRQFGSGRSHAIAGVFVFLLLGMFAIFSMMLVLTGAQAYRATTDATAHHNTERILHAYLFTAVRADDASGVLRLDNKLDRESLVVMYDFGGDVYEKRIYCYDGALREYFSWTGYAFNPAEGEIICEAESFHAEIDGNLMTVVLTVEDGREYTTQIALRAMRV